MHTASSNLNEKGLRLVAGIMLVNKDKKVFVGQRLSIDGTLIQNLEEGWQMPQGGIDKGETPLQSAFRELKEETGCDKAELIAESQRWHNYQLPDSIRFQVGKAEIHTIRQKWFLFNFTGKDEDFNLKAFNPPEFSAWKWVTADQAVGLIVDFKKEVYKNIAKEFKAYL